eukprot:scaffold21488_cov38-Tisochrysis_lutea.AAC.1
MSAIPHQLNPTGFVVPYELRSSSIAGLGLFATTHIARGTLLWKADHKSQIAHTEAQLRAKLATLSRAEAVDLLEHIYCWGGEVLEIVGDAKFWNHSRVKQNTGNHPDGNSGGQGDGLSSYALRDIEPAEEFLDDYAAYSKVPWFEALCLEYDGRWRVKTLPLSSRRQGHLNNMMGLFCLSATFVVQHNTSVLLDDIKNPPPPIPCRITHGTPTVYSSSSSS